MEISDASIEKKDEEKNSSKGSGTRAIAQVELPLELARHESISFGLDFWHNTWYSKVA